MRAIRHVLTFQCQHKVIQGVHVLFVGFGVVLLYIFIDGLLHHGNGSLREFQRHSSFVWNMDSRRGCLRLTYWAEERTDESHCAANNLRLLKASAITYIGARGPYLAVAAWLYSHGFALVHSKSSVSNTMSTMFRKLAEIPVPFAGTISDNGTRALLLASRS